MTNRRVLMIFCILLYNDIHVHSKVISQYMYMYTYLHLGLVRYLYGIDSLSHTTSL